MIIEHGPWSLRMFKKYNIHSLGTSSKAKKEGMLSVFIVWEDCEGATSVQCPPQNMRRDALKQASKLARRQPHLNEEGRKTIRGRGHQLDWPLRRFPATDMQVWVVCLLRKSLALWPMAVYVENIVTQNSKLNCGFRMFDYNIIVIIIFSYQSNIVRNPEIKYMINLIISAFMQEA